MSAQQVLRWLGWVIGGGLLGEFVLCATAFLWCLPYMTSQSYCTGDAPFVGYMLVSTSPFAILVGSITAGIILRKRELKETLRKQAEELEKLSGSRPPSPLLLDAPADGDYPHETIDKL